MKCFLLFLTLGLVAMNCVRVHGVCPTVLPDIEKIKNLAKEQIAIYNRGFKLYDSNGDCAITKSELGSVMELLGRNPSDLQLQLMMMHADKDGNGTVDYQEYVQMMADRKGR